MQTEELSLYDELARQVVPHLNELAACRSTAQLEAHPRYRSLAPVIQAALATLDAGDFTRAPAPARPRYRLLAWNIERGAEFEGQLEALRAHPYLRTCDVLLLTEADLGMARSGNRAVARELASELGMHYAFAPCYLNLTKGSGMESRTPGENSLGLHGNAILSRYPLRRIRAIPLRNGIDKMASPERRIGSQAAVAAEVVFPNLQVTAVSVHLDAQSTQRHRRDQMRSVLDQLDPAGPVILGGDWNTSTYNSSHAFFAIMGFWLRVSMGVDNVIRNHYLHPDRKFERGLFRLLEERGFDYQRSNRLGEHTGWYSVDDVKTRQALGDWVPAWCFAFIRWALRNHGGHCPIKLDWFATRGLRPEHPVIVHEVREGRTVPLSDHDAIGVDVVV
ncbi:MAG TPA: endonuclease/exonuclease/phosphatase family protein [Bryobacteraceae bacterium]|nr:endonuclease/exonuclease/phosphatase family protein [Bryobacteraceae bacterium]